MATFNDLFNPQTLRAITDSSISDSQRKQVGHLMARIKETAAYRAKDCFSNAGWAKQEVGSLTPQGVALLQEEIEKLGFKFHCENQRLNLWISW